MKVSFLLLFSLFFNSIFCQESKSIQGTYSAILPKNKTIEEFESYCITQARLSALGNHFGYRVSEVTINNVKENNQQLDENFQVLTQTNVLGEWISDNSAPKITWQCNNNQLEVTVSINGNAIAYPSGGRLQWNISTFREIACTHPISTFSNEDNLFLKLKCSNPGYINVFYWDHAQQEVVRLLPSAQYNDLNGIKIKGDQYYTLFKNPSDFKEHPTMLDLQVSISKPEDKIQNDEVIILYSEKEITKPILTHQSGLYLMKDSDYLTWKNQLYSRQNLIDIQSIPITITR